MHPKETLRRWSKLLSRTAVALMFVVGVTVLLLWLAGTFVPKVPNADALPHSRHPEVAGRIETVRLIRIPREESAVGTIRAVHETTIGSKLMARVMEVNLKAGQHVQAGEVLVRLDDADLRAKLEQSLAAVTAAEAAHLQAISDEKRYAGLLKSNAVSRQDYEKTATAVKSSEAELRRAREIVKEVQATLDWATVRSPMAGTVIDKKVDVGDLVRPGQMLVSLFDPKRMQLVSSVRESLAQRLEVGQEIGVEIEGLGKHCTGTISEIVPEAQAASRAFQVKVTGPCPTGIYTGMFARMQIPLEEEDVLVVPRVAVRNVGQLELVDVVDSGHTSRRAVRTGRSFDADVEVLSGLQAGEQVAVPVKQDKRSEGSHE
ncbi:MAG: efflux RND transporter periplasmic adaptor subunit [Planctomycetes bacterium]|nr:efflux RND transporter periplasmic adaptor subunit [Planctomycetota bacterium]